jgi:ribosomal protein S18 acetylase RimI-like enzyme
MISIELLRPEHLPQVRTLINAHLGALVPGWAISETLIASQIQRNPGEHIVDPWVIARTTVCALERQRVVAVAHLLCYGAGLEVSQAYHGIGNIDWFFVWPGTDAAAAAVLAAADQQFATWGIREQQADIGMLVGPICGVPDVWPHIAAALRTAGYLPLAGRDEMLYGGRIDQIAPPDGPPVDGLTIQRTTGSFGTRFTVGLADQQLGLCECLADLTEGDAAPALRGWAELAELEVAPDWQRRGIGTWLLRHAIAWLRFGGCDRIVLAVAAEAEAAGAGRFYQRFGWERLARQEKGWYPQRDSNPRSSP